VKLRRSGVLPDGILFEMYVGLILSSCFCIVSGVGTNFSFPPICFVTACAINAMNVRIWWETRLLVAQQFTMGIADCSVLGNMQQPNIAQASFVV